MADKLPQNTSDLLSQIEPEWSELLKVVDRLTPTQMITPDSGGWSPKDNLAHLAAWMNFMRECYLDKKPAHEAMGIEAATYGKLDETGINAVLFERNRGRTVSDVLEGLKLSYKEVVETLKKMPFTDLMKPLRDNDPEKQPVIQWVLGNTSEHFVEHRATIEKVIQPRK
jgi:hypothetical protein